MTFVATYLFATTLLHPQGSIATPPKAPDVVDSRPPQWVDFGEDGRHRRMWVRIQRDPRTDSATLLEFYADGHLVKAKAIDTDAFFLSDVRATPIRVGDSWILFYDSHPGAGDTWFSNYLKIRRGDLRFEKLGQFEHGDASSFQTTRRFYEYKLLKYQDDHRFRRLGVFGYRIVDWRWDRHHQRFVRVRHWYSPRPPRSLWKRWEDPPEERLNGNLVGTLDYFRPLDPAQYGLPKDSHFMIAPEYGFGSWTVGLVTGKITFDETNLIQGLKELAGLDYPVGDLDPHHPPQLEHTRSGLVLTLRTCMFRHVRVSRFLVATKPYKISLLGSSIEPEWTPFQRSAKPSPRQPAAK